MTTPTLREAAEAVLRMLDAKAPDEHLIPSAVGWVRDQLRAALAREPEPPRPPLCPDCGQPMAQARQGEDVYLCANLDCVPRPPTRLLVSREWLRARIMSDPDLPTEAGAASRDEPRHRCTACGRIREDDCMCQEPAPTVPVGEPSAGPWRIERDRLAAENMALWDALGFARTALHTAPDTDAGWNQERVAALAEIDEVLGVSRSTAPKEGL